MCCMNKCKECLFNYGFSDNIQISDAPYSVQGKEFLKKAEILRIAKEKNRLLIAIWTLASGVVLFAKADCFWCYCFVFFVRRIKPDV